MNFLGNVVKDRAEDAIGDGVQDKQTRAARSVNGAVDDKLFAASSGNSKG